jgi:uncharacterized membrane protein (Fun14 family)
MATTRLLRVRLVLVALLLLVSLVWAAAAGGPTVDWEVLGGGGAPAVSSSGSVHLNATLGQTAIGLAESTGMDLVAGFWHGLSGKETIRIYLPLVLREH